jgi:phosphate starvation-inducible PhoH-like protein
MTKTERKEKRELHKMELRRFDDMMVPTVPEHSKPLVLKTETQKRYANAIKAFKLVFGLGPAGTGKTYVAGALAAQALNSKQVEKIVITRPAVEAGEYLGALPGEMEEKYAPYIQAFMDVLNERLGPSFVEYLLKNKKIEAAPLAYMRGRTFKNSFVIFDEAQDSTPVQMKLFLTRIGENCNVVVNGDESQVDIKGTCGLTDAVARLSFIPSIKVVRFTRDDIVRSSLVQEIVQAYESDTSYH